MGFFPKKALTVVAINSIIIASKTKKYSVPFSEERKMKGGGVLLNVGILAMVMGLVLAAKTSAWTGVDVGDCPAIGSDSYDPNSGKWTLQGDGHDIWGSADAFHYVYKYLKGDGSLTARVVSIGGPGTHEWRKAGVMMREDLSGGSRHAMMAMTPTAGHSAAFQIRQFGIEGSATFHGGSYGFHSGSYGFPYWVRVVREVDTFTGYISSDGNDWQQQGSSVTIGMRDSRGAYAGCYVGLCLTSHESGTLASAEFDNVSYTGSVTDEPPPILKAWNPDPRDGADYVTESLFQWMLGDTAKWHDVYFGTNPMPGPAEFIARQDFNVYEHDADFLADTTYYWRIDEVEPNGTTIHTGDVWSFTTAPPTAWNPNPAEGASFIDLDVVLNWSAGIGATTHDVYFGTDEVAVADGNGGTFKGNQSDTTFDPGTLARYTNYCWRIDEFEADGTTKHTGSVWSFTTRPRSATYDISASSYIGGSDANDSVRGCAIQSDGTVILAANIGDATPGGVTPILLNGATSSSPGAIVRLSPDGTTVLSVTRLADLVLDLVVDDSDNIYVALWTQGMVKLNPTATSVLWSKTPESGNIMRLDASPKGYCVTLKTWATDPDTDFQGRGWIRVYDPNGIELGDFQGGGIELGTYPGYSRTCDVCIDESSQTVVHTGWRQADIPLGALQVAYVQGRSYTGTVLWTGYDWSAYPDSDRYINRSGLNMADTRGYRCCIGRDGKLYCAFIFHGGMHMQRYDPFDIMKPVEVVGGDMWFETWNTGDIHETFVGRYEPATGEYLLGQQFTCRLSDTTGNTVTVDAGEICADELGRVYVGGRASWGLPIPGHPAYTCNPGQVAFNPLASDYLGGAWLLVLSSDFSTRLYCTRLTFEQTHAIAARVLSGTLAQIVFGGYSTSELYTKAAIQNTLQGGQDGWFAVIPPEAAPTILYVDSNAPGKNNGTSWTDAFNFLQDALCTAISISDANEVRVAQGAYTPDRGRFVTSGDRKATFQLLNGVAIRGGYAGFGTPDPNARDIEVYKTILSGDLDGNDVEVNDPCDLPTEPTRVDNSYHVVTGSGTDPTAILDGCTITSGYAHDKWPDNGGGLYNGGGNPTLIDCTFSGNSAGSGGGIGNRDGSCPLLRYCTLKKNYGINGGGMYNKNNSNPTLTNCTFTGNRAHNTGGGMTNYNISSPSLTDCQFIDNSAHNGGGMCADVGSSPIVTNCSFRGNSAGWRGGGMFADRGCQSTLANCTFSENSAGSGGGMYNSNSSATLTHCVFTGNSGNYGGGLNTAGDSSLTLTDCSFNENSAEDGGGFSNGGSSSLSNCTFIANLANENGGGIFNAGSPILMGCTFSHNSGELGGGMHNTGPGNTKLTNCTFSTNSAVRGGGMYNGHPSKPTLTDCMLSGNTASDVGGAMYNAYRSSPTLANCTLGENTATNAGGGMYNWQGSSVTATNCTFKENVAIGGGGMAGWDYDAYLAYCVFNKNSVDSRGGGMHNDRASPTLVSCEFTANRAQDGAGIYGFVSSPVLMNCTFSANLASSQGGAMWNRGSPTLTNSILWGDSPAEIYLVQSSPVITYCDIQGGWSGYGNINADPLFANAASSDYHLLPGSPCIEAGDPNFIPGPNDVDMDGQPRVVGSRVDIGADEFAYIGDFDFNGSVNMLDFAMFAAHWPEISCGACGGADLTGDGEVGLDDLREFVANWLADVE